MPKKIKNQWTSKNFIRLHFPEVIENLTTRSHNVSKVNKNYSYYKETAITENCSEARSVFKQ